MRVGNLEKGAIIRFKDELHEVVGLKFDEHSKMNYVILKNISTNEESLVNVDRQV